MIIENGVIEQISPIGLISVDIRSRKSVSYCTKNQDGEISDLHTSVIFRCDINNNGVTKNGWTHSAFVDECLVRSLDDVYDVLINPDTCIAWDGLGVRIEL